MNNYKVGQKLMWKPAKTLDEPYPEEQEVEYIGEGVYDYTYAVRLPDGKIDVIDNRYFTKKKNKVPIWLAFGTHLEENYEYDFFSREEMEECVMDYINTFKYLGVVIPEYIEVEE